VSKIAPTVEVDALRPVDIVVLGSVAVNTTGVRIVDCYATAWVWSAFLRAASAVPRSRVLLKSPISPTDDSLLCFRAAWSERAVAALDGLYGRVRSLPIAGRPSGDGAALDGADIWTVRVGSGEGHGGQ
jgi:hypothetical protein